MSTRHRTKHHPAHHPVHPIQSQQQQQQQQQQQPFTNNHRHHLSQPSDLDSDAAAAASIPPAPAQRTNGELNLLVLRRHHPSITSILSIAPYAVVYVYAPASQSWEKSGIEGTLFVCALQSTPSGPAPDVERFAAVVLNRRGLDPFFVELRSTADVEVTTEYVILKDSDNEVSDTEGTVYGLWVFAEPAPASTATARVDNARVIEACATRAEESRAIAAAATRAARNTQHNDAAVTQYGGEEMGRQLSLRDLFGAQRTADEGGMDLPTGTPPNPFQSQASAFNMTQQRPPLPSAGQKQQQQQQSQFQPSRDTEFFRNTSRGASAAQTTARINQPRPAAQADYSSAPSNADFLTQMLRASSSAHR